MPTPVDIRITPSLHADTLKEVDGYDDELTAPILAPALEALDDAYITLGKLHDARDAAKKNQAWTEGQQVLAVSDAAWKQQQALPRSWTTCASRWKSRSPISRVSCRSPWSRALR